MTPKLISRYDTFIEKITASERIRNRVVMLVKNYMEVIFFVVYLFFFNSIVLSSKMALVIEFFLRFLKESR